MDTNSPHPTIEWADGIEKVLKKEGEEAQSLYWLTNRASIVAGKWNDYISVPCIILQTVTGFLSASSGLVPPLALGAFSVFTGILSTILAYYKFSARAEGHRVCSQLYLKIYKKIEVELSLPIAQRMNPVKLLEDVRDKLARISEVAPEIPEDVIAIYKAQFKENNTSKPIIANGLDEISIYHEVSMSVPEPTRVRINMVPQ